MQYRWIKDSFNYDGTQLRSLYAYLEHGLLGDSVVAWAGPCQIDFQHMVDGEDLLAQSPITGDRMLHFIVEKFDCPLWGAVALQRLMASLCQDLVAEMGLVDKGCRDLRREGDDLYLGENKLSISIATQSPVSSLIHFAVNLTNEGTPVPTLCLQDLGVQGESEFAEKLMDRLCQEVESITQATRKVKWVR